ncbi:MAG: superoxide dismutase [Thermoanaerobaculia bacterium]
MIHTLPKLNYSYDALEPYIDARTMEIHHTKHHQAYIDNLNKALEDLIEFQNMEIIPLLKSLNEIPESKRRTVRNHGGGHLNHTIFWEIMAPNSRRPSKEFIKDIGSAFGSLENFLEEFKKTALGVFGSGWAWLVLDENKKLAIKPYPNQDNPYMENLYPIVGIDVWEHAYYLKYQNRRAEYIDNWFKVINWEEVEKRYFDFMK